MNSIPDILRSNALAKILDEFRLKYGQLSNTGMMYGVMVADQDAKALAVNTFFDANMNYWDIAAIGAALYGVSKQGRDFFRAEALERAALIYKNRQYFVQSIGSVKLEGDRERELILIMITDKNINIGLVMMQMKRFAPIIRSQVEQDDRAQQAMQMTETEFMKQLGEIKKELFSLSP